MGLIQVFYQVDEQEVHALSKIKNFSSKDDILTSIENIIDIDKAWDILLYLVTQTKGPSDHIFSKLFYPDKSTIELTKVEKELWERDDFYESKSYEDIQNKIDMGIGYVTPAQVKEIFNNLEKVNINQLLKECDFVKLNELGIYPKSWSGQEGDIDYVFNNYEKLLNFLQIASDQNKFVLSECE